MIVSPLSKWSSSRRQWFSIFWTSFNANPRTSRSVDIIRILWRSSFRGISNSNCRGAFFLCGLAATYWTFILMHLDNLFPIHSWSPRCPWTSHRRENGASTVRNPAVAVESGHPSRLRDTPNPIPFKSVCWVTLRSTPSLLQFLSHIYDMHFLTTYFWASVSATDHHF